MKNIILKNLTILIVFIAIEGCVDRNPYVTRDRGHKVKSYVLGKAPAQMSVKLESNLKNVVLLGYDVDNEEIIPGEAVTITWYWKCIKPPGPGWRLFTHLLNAKGRPVRNVDTIGQVRKNYQPEYWKKGEIIKDSQKIIIPKKWDSAEVRFITGLWHDKEGRLPIVKGPFSPGKRIDGPRIKFGKHEKSVMKIPYTVLSPQLDGDFDNDKAWQNAAILPPFKNSMSGEDATLETSVKVMWDDNNIYIAMRAQDTDLSSKYTKHDAKLWNADVFEIFIDPGDDERNYYELQVSPRGVIFDSFLPTYRDNKNDWSSNMAAKVKTLGTLNNNEDVDIGWTAEIAIPFALLNKDNIHPIHGRNWSMNFFRIDVNDKKNYYTAWSPPLRGDFHALDMFGQVAFLPPSKSHVGQVPEDDSTKK